MSSMTEEIMDPAVAGFALSPQQARLWSLGGGAGEPFVARLELCLRGGAPRQLVEGALRALADRFEILRTEFALVPEVSLPVQVIAEPGGRAAGLARWQLDNAADGVLTLRLEMPALLADRRGLLNLARELARELAALATGRPRSDEPVQFADLAQWQNDVLGDGEQGTPGRDTFAGLGRLAGRTAPGLSLPWPRHGGSPPRCERLVVPLLPELAAGLGARMGSDAAALRAFLAAAWLLTLVRLTDEHAPLLGVAFDGRNFEELEEAVGPFEKYLPLAFEVDLRTPFSELTRRTGDLLQNLQHWQEAFAWERSLGLPELRYAALLEVLPRQLPSFDAGPGLRLEVRAATSQSEPFELRLAVAADASGLDLSLDYDAALYRGEDVARLASELATLLAGAFTDPARPAGALPLLAPEEESLLLGPWSGVGARSREPRPCLPELVAAAVARAGGSTAVVAAGVSLSYDELEARAALVAAQLAAAGVGCERPVGLLAVRGPWLLPAVLGIWKVGAVVVALDESLPEERLRLLLATSGAALLLAEGASAIADPSLLGLPVFHLDALGEAEQAPAPRPTLPESLAYVIFTSGSTGPPKPVGIEHRQLAAYVAAVCERFALPAGLSFASVSTFAADLGHTVIFPALASAGCLHLVPAEVAADPAAYRAYAELHGIDVLKIVPGHLQALLHAGAPAVVLPRKVLICGGEASRWSEIDHLRALAPQLAIFNHYGPTETTVGALTYAVPPPAERPAVPTVPLGRPLAGAEVYLLDAFGAPVPIGLPGEVFLAGDGVARGYLGRPAATAERFVPHRWAYGERLYRSGDRARFLPDGNLEFLGRADHQVKIRGYRVELEEIGATLAAFPGVEAACVLAPEDERGERRLVAYAGVTGTVAAAELKLHLARSLPPAAVPGVFVLLPRLPRTANGKVDWKALPAPEALASGEGRRREPATPTEESLVALWGELLRVAKPGVAESFFDLGGHSLLAMRLVAEMGARFGVEVPLREFVAAPTIAAAASAIDRRLAAGGAGEGASIPELRSDAARRHEPFPLTDVQQAYWVGRSRSFELGNVATHTYLEYDTSGLDLARFEAALHRVITRHEMLRAVVLPSGEQVILSEVPRYRVRRQDLRAAATPVAEAALAAVRAEMSHQQLPAERWPLFEVRASLLPADRTRLHVSSDALVRDAWSFRILSRDLLAAYADPACELPPPGVSFRDYVLSEVAFEASATYQRSLAYWRSRLPELAAAPELPLAVNPATVSEPRFSLRTATLARQTWERLKARGARAGLSPTGLVLAAFSEVLAAWSKSPRLLINLTVFNRFPVHAEINDVVGDFTSLLLAEVDVSGGGPFEARARRVQERLWEDLDHRHMSGVKVLRELARRAGAAGRAVAPVVLTSVLGFEEEAAPEAAELPIPAELVFSTNQTPQVWLDHQAMEDRGALLTNWAVVDELFPPGLIDDLFAAYGAFLERLAAGEGAWQDPVPALLPAAQQARRAAYNSTAAPLPRGLLHQAFLERARAEPERPAVLTPERRLSYGELDRASRHLARRLRALGAAPNQLVAVVMEKGWEQVVAALGILRAGAAYLPIDADLPAERLHSLLSRGGCTIAVTQESRQDSVAWPDGLERLALGPTALAASPENEAPFAEPVQREADLAYVIFTSGSTGQPKGVAIDHRGAANTAADINTRFAVGPGDRVLALSSLSFDLSVYDLFGLLGTGGALVLPAPAMARDPGAWCRLAAEQEVTLWNSVPALFELWVEYLEEHPAAPRAPLRLALLSGDWIPVGLPSRLGRLLPECQLVSLGGATEASIWSILYPVTGVDPGWKSIPYGKPMKNQTFHVLDPCLRPRPEWVPGELYIGGIGVARGYFGDEERTRASFLTHPETDERLYRTGDLGRMLPDGNIEFLGREDLQVKVQGHRIELGEVEAALAEHPAVAQAVVVATPRELGARRLIGYAVPHAGREITASELGDFLRAKLPGYMVPSTFVLLAALPLSANGKLDRGALPAPEAAPEAAMAEAPLALDEGSLAARVAAIVAAVLRVPAIDPRVSLLELGATSIDIVRVANKLEDEFGERPPISELFQRSVLELVASHFDSAAAAPAASSPAVSPRWAGAVALRDPDERERFKEGQPGLRRDDSERDRIDLPGRELDGAHAALFLTRRSHRAYSSRPVPLAALGELLGALRRISLDATPKYRYGSAGGLYAVQTYLYAKPEKVLGLNSGVYAYDPLAHQLARLGAGTELTGSLYGWISRPVFEAASFALYLVAQARAIVPMYGERARDFCLIEAGLMAQLLESEAPGVGLGLCQIGGLDFERVRADFALDDGHELVHSLVGGAVDRDEETLRREVAEADVWAEGTL